MMTIPRGLAFMLLMGLSTLATAQRQPIAPYEPVQGAWYPVGKPGIYVNVDVGPTGFTFVSIHDFDATGRERTRYLQGPLERSADADWESTGIRARMRSRVYVQEGGSCLNCPYVPERTRDLDQGDAEVRFQNGSTGTLRLEGLDIPIERYGMYSDASGLLQNRLVGRQWLMTSRLRYSDRIDTVRFVPFVRPPSATITLLGPPDVGAGDPGADRYFVVTCGTCDAQRGGPLTNGLLVVHDGGKLVYYNFYSGFFGAADFRTYKAAYRLTDLEGMIEARGIPSAMAEVDVRPDLNYPDDIAREFKLVPLPPDWRP